VLARYRLTLSLVILIAASLIGASASAGPASQTGLASGAQPSTPGNVKVPWGSGVARFVPGRVVVVWKDGASRLATRALNARLGARTIAPMAGSNLDVVRVGSGTSVSAAIHRYQRSPLVRFAERDRIATLAAAPPITNDPLVDQQWALNNTGQSHEMTNQGGGFGKKRQGTVNADVDAPEAWAVPTHAGVHPVVAVIDTGIDINQPDLVNQLWVNTAEKNGTTGVDDDHNGFIDDVYGWDFKGNDPNPSPANTLDDSHGTHVAGIVAAEQGNSEGISGVCLQCRIMALRIGTAASITLGNELKAIYYAIRNHADVINLSLGDPVWSKAERAAIARAGKAGILVVVAAGNSSMDNDIQFYEHPKGQPPSWAPSYPASYTLKNIIAVAASNDRDQYGYVSQCQGVVPLWQCAFTSWGHDSVDVAAPGVDILSTVKAGLSLGHTYPNYEFFDGTSMAAPMVAGIAGLVRSAHALYTGVQIKNAIMHSVDHPASLKLFDAWGPQTGLGKSPLTGHFTRTQGRVNAFGALTASKTNATPLTDGNIDGAKLFASPKIGHLSWPADANDVYRRKLRKGTRYQVILNGPSGSDMDLWVWRPGTTEIFQFTPGCFVTPRVCPALQAVSGGRTADEKVTFKAPKTGVFYIQVNGWYSGGRYKLTLKKV
jgi:subtilisin family serine protease